MCANIKDYTPDEAFDVVVANFFLNVFSRPVMEQVLARLASLVRAEGKLLIADFAPAQGNILQRAQHHLYYVTTLVPHWLTGLCALHPIYVYSDSYPRLGLKLERTQRFRLPFPGFSPWIFQSTVARKVG